MDRHDVPGATAEDVAAAHVSDLELAGRFDVEFFSYWFDPDNHSVFCFARAPSPEAMTEVHERSHGLLPAEIIEVSEGDVVRFLGQVHDPRDASEVTNPFRVIVFTDLVDSTRVLNQLGQSEFMVLLSEHDLILRKALVTHEGREVKHTGDGIMASFREVSSALRWCVEVQRAFIVRPDMSIRIGVSAGEPVDHNEDMFGSAVNLANRICSIAESGQVLTSDLVRDLGVASGFSFDGGHEVFLKGFTTPQEVFELRDIQA